MPAQPVLIAGWVRSAVAPCGGAFRELAPHELGAPVLRALLARAGTPQSAVDAVVVGNALGAGGNIARLVALAAGLPDATPALTVDTQCCAGLDAVSIGVGMLAAGHAQVVVAGGVEAWSRAPIRQHRPLRAGEVPTSYERPAFAPTPERDPDMLESAARYALAQDCTRTEQDGYALRSHERALARQLEIAEEVVAVAGVDRDLYPRSLSPARAARLPAPVKAQELGDARLPLSLQRHDCSMSTLAISPRADGAAFVLLATPMAAARFGLQCGAQWVAGASVGVAPETPLLAAEAAARRTLERAGLRANQLRAVELHDAFAVQGITFSRGLALEPHQLNPGGGGLARGHPIGASGAVALVRLLSELETQGRPRDMGMAAIAAAGGIGTAAVVRRA